MQNSSFNNFLSEGKLNIFNEDALDFLPKLENESIDLIYCDLPFGTTQCGWDEVISFDKMWEQVIRIAKQNTPIVFHAQQPFTSALVMSNPKNYKHEWIWQKDKGSNFANTVREPMKEHENILVFANKKWTYNKQMEERKGSGSKSVGATNKHYKKSENYGLFQGAEFKVAELRVPSSIQFVKRQTGEHPTQKPLELLEYLIKTYTNEGDMVLDNTMGSGTTNLACIKLNRKSIGIEKEKAYYDVAVRRASEYCH
jgi:site-specific DNA-methyltransferase (adenine-specific)